MPLRSDTLRARAERMDEQTLGLERKLAPLLKRIDTQVKKRGKAELVIIDTTAEIARLALEVQREAQRENPELTGAPMGILVERIQRIDRKTRELRPVTRQAVDLMMAKAQGLEPGDRRRRRQPGPAGRINAEALR